MRIIMPFNELFGIVIMSNKNYFVLIKVFEIK